MAVDAEMRIDFQHGADIHAHTVGLDADIELGVDEFRADVVIEVIIGLDAVSEELLRKAERAARILYEEYGILAVVVPRVVHWDVIQPFNVTGNVPAVYVNGLSVGGPTVSIEEIIDAAFAMLGESEDQESSVREGWGPPRKLDTGAELVHAAALA